MKNFKTLLIFAFALSTVSSCGAIKTKYADHVFACRGNDTREPNFENDKFLSELADRFGIMALFSSAVYRDDLIKSKEDQNNNLKPGSKVISESNFHEACDYLSKSESPSDYGMPYEVKGSNYRWFRWAGSEDIRSEPCYNENGLFYETYVYGNKSEIFEAVIAYRGTENREHEFWYDWKTNLSGAFGIEPSQYKIAAEKLPKIINALKNENSDIEIYATGHSLGGGLAQQAGYLSSDIKEVFTFNTSPVTNWTSLALDGRIQNRYPIIHRVYNGGEALGGIRSVSTLFTKARYGRHDIGIQIKEKRLFAGHSMMLINCHFACLIEKNNNVAKHHYSPHYIRNELIAKGKSCEGYVDINKCELSSLN